MGSFLLDLLSPGKPVRLLFRCHLDRLDRAQPSQPVREGFRSPGPLLLRNSQPFPRPTFLAGDDNSAPLGPIGRLVEDDPAILPSSGAGLVIRDRTHAATP